MPTNPVSVTSSRANAARAGYLLIILVATLTNLHFEPNMADVAMRLHRALDLSVRMNDVVDGARNVVLFAGLGAVWLATTHTTRPLRVIARVTALGLVLSFGVEVLQLFSPLRRSSILDVTTDTLGTLAGALGTLVAFESVKSKVGKPSYVGIPAFVFALSYGAAILMETFFPLLRQDLLPNLGGEVRQRLAEAWAAIDPHWAANLPLTDIVIFFPLGVFAVATAAEAGIPFAVAWPIVALVGTAMVALVELAHGVALLPIVPAAILVHAAGIAGGALVAALGLNAYAARLSDRARPKLLLTAYAIILMTWSWRPFRLELNPQAMAAQFSVEHLIPLRALASRMDLFSVTDVVAQFVLFLPIGALLTVWPLRRGGPLGGLFPALYLSVLLELGKIVVAERFLDVTHILIQCSGAAIGWLLIHRAGFRSYGALFGRASSAGRFDRERVADPHLVTAHVVPLPDLGRSGAKARGDGR